MIPLFDLRRRQQRLLKSPIARDAFIATTATSRDNTHQSRHKQQARAIAQAVSLSVRSNEADKVRMR